MRGTPRRISSGVALVATRELLPGDIMLMVGGGHGFRMLEDTVLLEVKQGPYTGLDEKERFYQAIERFGAGTGSVRTIAGTMELHMVLERRIAAFKKTEASVVFQSGFTANAGTVSSVLTRGDVVVTLGDLRGRPVRLRRRGSAFLLSSLPRRGGLGGRPVPPPRLFIGFGGPRPRRGHHPSKSNQLTGSFHAYR